MAYKYELFPPQGRPPLDVVVTFTNHPPKGWQGYRRRIDEQMLREQLQDFSEHPAVYVCGPTPMVESVTQSLVKLGIDPSTIRAERFGATA
jgi:ferredoxin-NADP reductase